MKTLGANDSLRGGYKMNSENPRNKRLKSQTKKSLGGDR